MMMNLYKFRYGYAFALLLVMSLLIFKYDLRAEIAELKALKKIKTDHIVNLKATLMPKANANRMKAPKSPTTLLSFLQRQVVLTQLNLEKLNVLSTTEESMLIRLMVTGGLNNGIHFIKTLNTPGSGIVLTNFVYTVKTPSQYRLVLDLLLSTKWVTLTQSSARPLHIKSLFCKSDAPLAAKLHHPFRYSLKAIQLIATLQQSGLKEAWLRLPDTSIVAVKQGALFGKERAELSRITSNHLVWIFANHQSFLMWINNKT